MAELATVAELAGRHAVVAGGSRGIGAATALRLAREGADVAVGYVSGKEAAEDVVRAVRALGRRAVAVRADMADADDAAGAVATAAEIVGFGSVVGSGRPVSKYETAKRNRP